MNRISETIVVVLALAALLLIAAFGPARWPDGWLTADQRGDRLVGRGLFADAARAYADPVRQGAALFRAGDFKAAEAAFGRGNSPESAFNRGNALVLLGKYDDAIKSYDRALALRPGWADAEDNRAVARIRRERLQSRGGDATGGEESPDEVVFGKIKTPAGPDVQVAGTEPLSDDQLQALWLRRVQTKPADFLRGKFAFQLQAGEGVGK